MKFFGKEVPPRIKQEIGKEEYGIRPEEPIFRPRPEPLDVTSLVEKAKAGEAIEMVPELDEYVDSWTHYAQDRNLFGGSAEMRALAQARREAIQLAREKKFDELQSKLEELSGPVAEGIEHAAEENLARIQEARDATPKEHREHLADAIQEVEGAKQPTEAAPKKETAPHRDAEREMRAQKFAEKYDIVAEREALLLAEENYAEAIRKRNESFFKLKMRDDAATKGQREILESAIQTWREALAKVSEEARKSEDTKQDAITARFLSARDAMMRMEQVRQRAVAEGLDNRSKTAIGKVDAWANRLNAKLFSGAAAAGKGFGKVSEAVGGLAVGRFLDKEADAEKYKRASRIVGSAAIMTAIFAPFGAVTAGAAGMTFVWRTARGLLGWGVGSAAGAGAGKLYDVRHGSEEARLQTHVVSQEDLLDALKNGRIEVIDQKVAQQLYKEGSTTQFNKREQRHKERKMRAELATSALVAGVSAYGLSHFPPVHEALTNHPAVHPMQSAPPQPNAPAMEQHGAPVHAPEAVTPAVHIESVSVHGNVNDADKLFGRFIDNARTQFPNPEAAPPALRTLLEQYHHVDGMHQEDVLTKFLHLQNGGSVVVHPGDTLSYENGKVVFQGHELIDEHGTVHNLREGGEVRIMHPHAEQAPSLHEHVEKPAPAQPATPVATTPIASAPAEPHAATLSQPAPAHVPPPAPAPEHVPPASEHVVSPPAAPEHAPAPEHVVPTHAPEHAPEHVVPAPEHVAPATPAPEHVTPAAPAHEVPSNDNTPPPAPESAIPSVPSVEHLTQSPLWNMAHTREAYTLFDTPVPASATDAASFRQNLFDLMRTSGVGPSPHETVDQYLARAEAAISKGDVVKPVIVQTPDQQMLVAHGGDLNARMLLTREFLREYYDAHPDTNVNVVVENNPGSASRGFIVTTESVEATKDDTIYYPTFEESHVGDHHKVVFPKITRDMQVIF